MTRHPILAATLIAMLTAALFLLAEAPSPIILWDESRTILNALAMVGDGFSLVTRYGDTPDLWNTKPPLIIWAMAGAVDLFGPHLWALRLPSLLAAIGTIGLVATFVRRLSGSTATALLAAAILLLSPGFWGEHAARTADYDAPLTFLTTLYALAAFHAFHQARPPLHRFGVIGVALATALLTKSVAAFVPAAGLIAYALLTRRLPRLLRDSRYPLTAFAALVPLALFALMREAAAPGWIAAAWHNDVAGRLSASLIGTPKPATFYLDMLVHGWAAAAPLLLLTPIALVVARGRRRLALGFALTMATAILIAVTAAASKLSHYALPALPFIAIAIALTVQALLAAARARSRLALGLALVIVAIPLGQSATASLAARALPPGPRTGTGEAASQYGALLDALVPLGPVTILDPGFPLEDHPGYTPVLDAYRMLWRLRGVTIAKVATLDRAPATGIVASCDPVVAPALGRMGRPRVTVPGCTAIRR